MRSILFKLLVHSKHHNSTKNLTTILQFHQNFHKKTPLMHNFIKKINEIQSNVNIITILLKHSNKHQCSLFTYLPPLKIQFLLFLFAIIVWHHLDQLHISIVIIFLSHLLFSSLHVKAGEGEEDMCDDALMSVYYYISD